MLPVSSQRKMGFFLLASGSAILLGCALYSAIADYKAPSISSAFYSYFFGYDSDKVTIHCSPWASRWKGNDEGAVQLCTVTVAGDAEWHTIGLDARDGLHYRVAPEGEFHPVSLDICGTVFNFTKPLLPNKFYEAYTVARSHYQGRAAEPPITLFTEPCILKMKSDTGQPATIFFDLSDARGRLNSMFTHPPQKQQKQRKQQKH